MISPESSGLLFNREDYTPTPSPIETNEIGEIIISFQTLYRLLSSKELEEVRLKEAASSLKGWNAVVETNLTGTFLLCKEAYNQWFQQNGGSIVNIIADMWRGFPMMSHTGAARHAVFNLTKSLAIEWAEHGVRVNAIAPGVIESPTAAANYKVENVFAEIKEHLPSKRTGVPEEVSSAVCFLLSPGASYITGTTLKVDSGSSLYIRIYWSINDHDKLPANDWIPPAKL